MGATPREFRERTNAREYLLFTQYIQQKAAQYRQRADETAEARAEAEQAQQQVPNEAPTQWSSQRRSPPG